MTESSLAYSSVLDPKEERDRIIMEELPQVNYIARRIHERLPEHVPFEDLVHAGVLGLIEALGHYDPSKKIQFKTFAQFRIRGAILDSLREMDWGSRKLRRQGRAVEDAVAKLAASLGRHPAEQEIAAELGMDLAQLHRLLAKLDGLEMMPQQTDAVYDRSETQDRIALAPSKDESPFEQYARVETKENLARAIATLNKNEQMVLSLYYQEELTMKEVAAVLQVTESRVSQIHSTALASLRGTLKRSPAAPPPRSAHYPVGESRGYAKSSSARC